MKAGFADYGCCIQESKTVTNFKDSNLSLSTPSTNFPQIPETLQSCSNQSYLTTHQTLSTSSLNEPSYAPKSFEFVGSGKADLSLSTSKPSKSSKACFKKIAKTPEVIVTDQLTFCGSRLDPNDLSCRPDFSSYFNRNIVYATTINCRSLDVKSVQRSVFKTVNSENPNIVGIWITNIWITKFYKSDIQMPFDQRPFNDRTHIGDLNICYSDITHIQDVHNIAAPLVPYNHACPKRGLIHQDRVMQLMKQALYLQATTAGWHSEFGHCWCHFRF